jgi:WD40 repeat protein
MSTSDAALPPEDATVDLQSAPPPGSLTVAHRPSGDVSLDPGLAILGYEILGELGRGGMGVVYKARQVELNRIVALKMILAGGHAAEADLERFRREAEAVARLQHPNIVQIYEIGMHQGKPFTALEYCGGGSLEESLRGLPQPPRESARLVETLARAMYAVHGQQIVHRDLKPANVLLAGGNHRDTEAQRRQEENVAEKKDNSSPSSSDLCVSVPLWFNSSSFTPKITDFGIAKKLDEVGRTQTGAILGTAGYMAPEQAGGKVREIGPAVDVYALGAILYEMLTGRPPFQAATVLDTLRHVVETEPVPPSRLVGRLPRDLETIVLKCLEKHPSRRYAGACDLADDLERFLAGKPIVARPVGAVEHALKWARRSPAVAALAAAVALVTVVGFALVTWKWLDADGQRKAAEEASAQWRDAENRATARAHDAERAVDSAERAREELARNVYLSDVSLGNQLFLAGNVERARKVLARCPPQRRRWEWSYLDHQTRNEPFTFRGHAGGVTALAFSPDGRLVASAGHNGHPELAVWVAASGKIVVRRRIGGAIRPADLAFSPDGKHLAFTDNQVKDKQIQVQVLALSARREVAPFALPCSEVLCLAYTTNGKLLATTLTREEVQPNVMKDDRLTVVDVATGKVLHRFSGFSHPPEITLIYTAALSPDGRHLALTAHDSGLWRADSSKAAKEDRAVAPRAFREQLHVFDLEVEKLVRVINGATNHFGNLAFSSDSARLAWGSGARVMLCDLAARQEPRPLLGHKEDVQALAFSNDGKTLASGGGDRLVIVWDRAEGTERFRLRGHLQPISALTFRPDGKRLASASQALVGPGQPGQVKVWDTTTQPEARTVLGPHSRPAFCLAVSPEGERFVLLEMDRPGANRAGPPFSVRDGRTGRVLFTRKELGGIGAAFRPRTGQLALLAGLEVKVLDAAGRESLALQQGLLPAAAPNGIVRLAFSADGSLLAAVWPVADGAHPGRTEGRIWDAASGKLLRELRSTPGDTPGKKAVTALTFSFDGKHLAAGVFIGNRSDTGVQMSGEVQTWDVRTGQPGSRFPLPYPVLALAYSRDGSRLATGGGTRDDGGASVHDIASRREVLALAGQTRPINAVAFTADGTRWRRPAAGT